MYETHELYNNISKMYSLEFKQIEYYLMTTASLLFA